MRITRKLPIAIIPKIDEDLNTDIIFENFIKLLVKIEMTEAKIIILKAILEEGSAIIMLRTFLDLVILFILYLLKFLFLRFNQLEEAIFLKWPPLSYYLFIHPKVPSQRIDYQHFLVWLVPLVCR